MTNTSAHPANSPHRPRRGGALGAVGARILRSRRLMRAPIWLYRAGLGFVFGSRLLLLEHIGRTSGARRYVVLEVVDRSTPDVYVVASGFGTRSQWFRNVRANPQVRVAVGRHRLTPATARQLPPVEASTSLQAYAARHPRSWAKFRDVLANTLGGPVDEDAANLPMIAFQLRRPR